MLGFLKPRGELVELSGRQVVFLIDKPYSRDSQFAVKLTMPEPNNQKVEMAVRVLSQRPGPNERYVTVAVVESRRDFPPMQGRPMRMSRRDSIRLTMKSGDLPGFRAVTEDLSLGGFKTMLEGELVEGDVIEVSLEFEQHHGFQLDLVARVQWVKAKGGGRFLTGFSFPREGQNADNYAWFCNWLENREDVEVRTLFKSLGKPSAAPLPPPSKPEPEPEPEPQEVLPSDLSVRIPFKGFLRGWAWEQGDDVVVVVLEDDEGVDHWLEFPGCRGLHARCRDRKIRLQGVKLVANSDLIKEYTRSVTLESLHHFQFLDDFARVCLDVFAVGCREQKRE